jgi:hypothetical protein
LQVIAFLGAQGRRLSADTSFLKLSSFSLTLSLPQVTHRVPDRCGTPAFKTKGSAANARAVTRLRRKNFSTFRANIELTAQRNRHRELRGKYAI